MSNPVKGILAMILGAALLSLNDAVSKFLTESYPIGQVIGLRQATSLLVILPYAYYTTGLGGLRVVNWGGQGFRGAVFVATAILMVLGLSLLPIATVTAIAFASPVFVAALSVALLGERVGWHRWAAIVVGFVGVLIIVRPAGASFEWALMIPVCAALANALRDIATRKLSRTETSISILFWSTVIVVVASLASIPFGWKSITGVAALWFLLNGLLAAGAHFLMIEALRLGEAALIAPFRYTALLWAILTGVLIWNTVPDAFVLIGALLVAASGIYILQREARA
jgi:drug/metabolite transporter (DMT)-like permease